MKTFPYGAVLATLLLMSVSFKLSAQNIQLHYDFERKCLTSSVELFYPDWRFEIYILIRKTKLL